MSYKTGRHYMYHHPSGPPQKDGVHITHASTPVIIIVAVVAVMFVSAFGIWWWWRRCRNNPNNHVMRGNNNQLVRGKTPDWKNNQIIDEGNQPYLLADEREVGLDKQTQRQIVQRMSENVNANTVT